MHNEIIEIIYNEFKDKYQIVYRTYVYHSGIFPHFRDICIVSYGEELNKQPNTVTLFTDNTPDIIVVSIFDPEFYNKIDRHLNQTCIKRKSFREVLSNI